MRNLLIHTLAAMLHLDAQVFHYQPHDVILFRTRDHLSQAQYDECRTQLKRCFTNDVAVVVFDAGFEWPVAYPVVDSQGELHDSRQV